VELIADNADCAGPSGFSFALITTVSDENTILRASLGWADDDVCSIAARAGNEVAAAEAAPRIRMNDLRETPCVIFEFIEVLLESSVVGIQYRCDN
jgi:hypothetical protein